MNPQGLLWDPSGDPPGDPLGTLLGNLWRPSGELLLGTPPEGSKSGANASGPDPSAFPQARAKSLSISQEIRLGLIELSAVALIYRLVEATPEVHPKWRRTKIFLCVSDCAVGLARVDGVLMDPRDPPTRTKKYCLILSNILRRFKLHSWCHVSNVKRPE